MKLQIVIYFLIKKEWQLHMFQLKHYDLVQYGEWVYMIHITSLLESMKSYELSYIFNF